MARSRAKSSTEEPWLQVQGQQPQGIEEGPARLQKAQQNDEPKHRLPSPPTTNPPNLKALHRLPPPNPEAVSPFCPPHGSEANRKPERKRKRSQEGEASPEGPLEKRPRADTINNNRSSHRVEIWLQKGSYPEDYFEPDSKTWEDIKADTLARRLEADGMRDLRLARKKSAASLRQGTSEENTDAFTENTGDKSLPYRSPGYAAELADQGSYLREAPEGITNKSKDLCQKLLTTTQAVPQDSDFHDDRFREVCDMVRDRNEARVVEDISPLIAPSPEKLKIYGAKELEHLVFNANERWSESIAVTKTRPQPDGSVGFKRSAFTESQVQKLLPYIGDRVPINFISLFLATWRTLFPFFTREAKGGEGDLDVADRQNAHSMTIAVRGIVELFKLVNRESELHREILAFSISHDASTVRIYGHYALIKERELTFWRHPIRIFDFTEQDGKEKWTAYQFTKNVYFEYMPGLHERICSAIDQLPLQVAPARLLPNPSQQIPINALDLDSEQPDSQDRALSAQGPQNPLGPKKRRLTGNAVLERQLDRKDEELERVRQENERLRLNANPGKDSEIVTMLLQQLEQQRAEAKQQLEQQREEAKQLREQLAREKEELMTMLGQKLG
ncbi:MAG: hypothetical protein Q9211_004957 [Gyalolechia sp. 1 TL-2023]